MHIFYKPFFFYILNLNFLKKVTKCVFKAFFSDQAFLDFLDTFSTFSIVSKKRLVDQSFEFYFLGIEKEYDTKIQIYEVVSAADSIIKFSLEHPVSI